MPDDDAASGLERDGQSVGGGVDSDTVPIVGIGASAGGVEALIQFFDAMPADSGLAFVVVLHLDPTRESRMSTILDAHTAMPVAEIEDGMEIAANHAYVIAPNHDLTVEGDMLRLTEPPQPRGHRHPVDVLFASIAGQRRERGIAIVLSGTGTNGTQGLREIKAAGGLILIQDPPTARFDGMPRSAIGADLADHVLAPADMPACLTAYLRHGYLAAPDGIAPVTEDGEPGLPQLLAILRAQSGQEFRSYKPAMILRRINRRMGLKNLAEFGEYIDLLRREPNEVRALTRDLLISVTSFFRDTEAWATLDKEVIRRMIADRETGAAIRVWVPACATGEEAYSVAMLFIEGAEAAHKSFDLKIFASDVLDDNLNTARDGVYPGSSVEMLPPERIRRFFEKLDGSYRVRKDLREPVVFARQDLLRDPPFSRMDLITCRNLLIYLEPEAQRRALALFHFALREGGRLFLGNAETIGQADDLFETVSKKWRIYCRIGATRHDIVDFPMPTDEARPHRADAHPAPEAASVRVTEMARRALLNRYAPASVLIDQKGRVLYFHGSTGDYLEQPTGEPTRDLLAMAREGLLARLRVALHQGIVQGGDTRFSAEVRQGGTLRPVLVTLSPLPATQQAAGLVLITFEPEPQPHQPVPDRRALEGGGKDVASASLENELRLVRAELQSTTEQMESVNEELKASNEEATSMNEELQSTNEELETSKEELQSFNEELYTVNNQLQHKVQELESAGNDMSNLLSGTEIATVFLDTEFRIKWFSPGTTRFLDFVPSDIGRPISHFALKFADGDMLGDAERVLARLIQVEAEVRGGGDRWFLRRMLPYRTQDNRIAGVVLTFIDITERKRANDATDEARIYAEAIVATVRQPLVVLDAGLAVQSANQAFYTLFATSPGRVEKQRIYRIGDGGLFDSPELRRLLEEVLPKDRQVEDAEIAFGAAEAGRRTMLVNARRLTRSGDREDLILLALEEITERKQAAERQEMLIRELNHRVKNVLATVQAIVSQTLRQSTDMDGFKAAFMGRLHALAAAHNLLAEKEWAGTDIRNIVARTLEPYRAGNTARIVEDGPSLTLRPQVGVALAMILHELATNGAKYGALSDGTGRLAVTWRLDGDGDGSRIHVQWRETGGPKVKPPSRQGFGTKFIERGAAHELGGEARMEYREEGLRCDLIFPWHGTDPVGRTGVG